MTSVFTSLKTLEIIGQPETGLCISAKTFIGLYRDMAINIKNLKLRNIMFASPDGQEDVLGSMKRVFEVIRERPLTSASVVLRRSV
jgi:hypothetical protein